MSKDLLLQQFDLLATAPGGVDRLRELILTQAVQGKLVPQDPADEPASELLKRIRAEKDRLIAEGKIKRDKPLEPVAEVEQPFELPEGWEWVRLGEIGVIGSSSRVHQKDWKSSGVPFYRAREIVKLARDGSVENDLFITEELFASLTQSGWVPEENDLMITGVGTIGIPYVVQRADKFYFKDASVLIFKNFGQLNALWLNLLMHSPLWVESIHEYSMGTTVDTLTIARANNTLLPLPTILEQARIVARVEELMRVCDALEAKGQQQVAHHRQLVQTLLGTLTDPVSATPTQDAWQRVAAHLDTLLDRPSAVDALEQTILQLAVRGQLVPQDPTDEPASELLKRIRSEKDRLIAAGKIKRDKPLTSIGEDEQPFELPPGWEWVPVDALAHVGTGTTPSRDNEAYFSVTGIPWITSGETGQSLITKADQFVTARALSETSLTLYPIGTLIVAMYGQGKTRGQVAELGIEAATNQACAAIVLVEPSASHRQFIKLVFEKSYDEIRSLSAGGAQPNLNVGKVKQTLIPLPPLTEQARIVTRVAQLRTLCAELRQRLTQSQSTQAALAESLVVSVA